MPFDIPSQYQQLYRKTVIHCLSITAAVLVKLTVEVGHFSIIGDLAIY